MDNKVMFETQDLPRQMVQREIESLRQQLAETKEELASCIEDLDREVRVGNDYMSQLAECERERDELVSQIADVKRVADGVMSRMMLRGFFVPQDTSDLIAALAKLGADKGEGS